MNTKNIILQELKELNSTLAGADVQNPYTVPAGYFDGLVAQVMRKIKTLEAANAAAEISHFSSLLSGVSKQMPNSVPSGYFETVDQRIAAVITGKYQLSANEELANISPLLSSLSKQMPYTIPAGYFESLEENSSLVAAGNYELTAEQELESLSPLLSSLKKTTPYSVPDGYFDQLTNLPVEISKPAAKVISLGSRKWFRVAAAAVVAGVVLMAGFMFLGEGTPKDPIAQAEKVVQKTSDKDLNEFLEFTAGETETVSVSNDNNEKDLLKDIPESELKAFLDETSENGADAETSNMN
jgi:hypothetical protein